MEAPFFGCLYLVGFSLLRLIWVSYFEGHLHFGWSDQKTNRCSAEHLAAMSSNTWEVCAHPSDFLMEDKTNVWTHATIIARLESKLSCDL